MAQHDYVIANGSGAAVRSDLNNALAAIATNNSGSTEPTTTYAYQFWADTTTGLLKLRNAANNAWITLRELDGTLTIEDGTVSAPGLAFASDLDTGFWRPGANQLAISTNGVERVEWGTTEVVFNDASNNYDFRIEGDTNANLFFVDASADAVGIGTSSPNVPLQVIGSATVTDPVIRATNSGATQSMALTSGGLRMDGGAPIRIHQGGSEVARIDTSGRLLVGTSTAGAYYASATNTTPQIQLTGTSNSTAAMVIHNELGTPSAASPGRLHLVAGGEGTGASGTTNLASGDITGSIHFSGLVGDGSTNSRHYNVAIVRASVDGVPSYTSTPGRIEFLTTASGVTSPTERMRIDSSGRVGIGTSSPATTLDVNGTVTCGTPGGVALSIAGGSAIRNLSAAASRMYFDTSFGSATHGSFEFRSSNAGTSRLVIDTSGNVGIGTSSPANGRLNVSSANNQITLDTTDTATYGRLDIGHFSNGTFIGTYAGSNAAADLIRFGTGGNERARIDSSGRLLVGTSSNLSNAIAVIQGVAGDPTTTGVLAVRYGSSRPAGADTLIGAIRFESTSNTASNYNYAQIRCETDGASSSDTDIPGRLVFSTTADGASSPTERMRITSAGSAQFAAATTGIVSGSASAAGTTYTTFIGQYNTAGGPGTGTNSFLVYTNGDVQNTNNSYGALSDIKLKENIVDATSQWSDIKALQVRKYNFKEGQTHTQIGLIAQEVELVSPGLVSESPDRDEDGNDLGTVTKSVNYSVLYMKAVKALQEAMERIETLEAKVAALESA